MAIATAAKKPAAKKAPADPAAILAKVYAAINKEVGEGTIHKGSESVPVNRLPFRQQNLNYATEGGAPWGRFTCMYGEESTGKSRVAYELLAQAQQLPYTAQVALRPRIAYHAIMSEAKSISSKARLEHEKLAKRLQTELEWIEQTFPDGAHAAYYNAEQQWDPVYAEKLGIDTDRISIIESSTIETIAKIMRGTYEHIPIHVIDSTSSASSLLSQKQEVGKSLMGTDARQWKASLRDGMEKFDIARNMGIFIQQMSTNLRTGGAAAQTTRYLKHTSSLSLRFSRGRFLYSDEHGVLKEKKPEGFDDDSMSGLGEADGTEVYVKVEKSRVCRPFRNAGLQWDYRKGGFVPIHEFFSTGLYHGFIKKNGSWFQDDEGKNLGQGVKAAYSALANDPDFMDRIASRQMDYVTDELHVKGELLEDVEPYEEEELAPASVA